MEERFTSFVRVSIRNLSGGSLGIVHRPAGPRILNGPSGRRQALHPCNVAGSNRVKQSLEGQDLARADGSTGPSTAFQRHFNNAPTPTIMPVVAEGRRRSAKRSHAGARIRAPACLSCPAIRDFGAVPGVGIPQDSARTRKVENREAGSSATTSRNLLRRQEKPSRPARSRFRRSFRL